MTLPGSIISDGEYLFQLSNVMNKFVELRIMIDKWSSDFLLNCPPRHFYVPRQSPNSWYCFAS